MKISVDSDWLCRFLKQNGPHMTMADLIEETGCQAQTIRKYADRLGIKIPSVFEVTSKFLIENKGKLSRERAMKILGLTENHLGHLLKKSGLSWTDFPKEEEVGRRPSVREVLSGFQKDDSNHWNHELDYKTIEDCLKS